MVEAGRIQILDKSCTVKNHLTSWILPPWAHKLATCQEGQIARDSKKKANHYVKHVRFNDQNITLLKKGYWSDEKPAVSEVCLLSIKKNIRVYDYFTLHCLICIWLFSNISFIWKKKGFGLWKIFYIYIFWRRKEKKKRKKNNSKKIYLEWPTLHFSPLLLPQLLHFILNKTCKTPFIFSFVISFLYFYLLPFSFPSLLVMLTHIS